MSTPLTETPVEQTKVTPTVADALRSPQRRYALAALLSGDDQMEPSTLLADVQARSTVDEESLAVRLHHVHLPNLADAGLIDRSGDTVSLTDHPLFDCPGIDVEALVDGDGWDALTAIASEPRRRYLLDVVDAADAPVPLEQLAALVGSRVENGPGTEQLKSLFHHVDLPRLAEIGVVTYNREEQMVAAAEIPSVLSLAQDA